jgi:cation diffusion facilitator CzcD-associated flavoprotein CzcO
LAADPILDVAVVGTGFSGLCMGIRLKQAGIDNFRIFEKAADVGGVWRANTYPGACCDIPANLYSFSFEMKTDWPRRYPAQPLIKEYLSEVASKYGLSPHIRFGAEVAGAAFDETSALWTVTLASGESVQARALVTGVGQLSRPAFPKIEGIERFGGTVFHSAEWDPAYSVAGKRVAVVGTGASAIQFIPEVANEAAKLHVVQRTPPYIVPKPDQVYGARHRFMFRYIPGYQKLYRHFWWRIGEISCGAFHGGSWLAGMFRHLAMWHMRHSVKDESLRAKLTPDYPIGCKRVLFSSNYFEALARPNVDVVTENIREASERGLVLESGREIEVDAIVYGTGFKATEFLSPMRISGRGGVELNQAWREGAEAYLGISVAGFPNFFMLYGPNTNLGSNSIVFMIECQANYIMQCLAWLKAPGAKFVDVRADVQRSFNTDIQAQLKSSVWSAGCHSWYHNASGKVTNNWPGYTAEYRRRTAVANADDYALVSG